MNKVIVSGEIGQLAVKLITLVSGLSLFYSSFSHFFVLFKCDRNTS